MTDRHVINKTIGSNVARRRRRLRLTEETMARLLGVPARRLQRYEAGQTGLSCDELIQLAALFRCSPDELCSDARRSATRKKRT